VTRGRILVVEYHPLNRELVVGLLEAAGCRGVLPEPLDTRAVLATVGRLLGHSPRAALEEG
jgi:CheY-like chemotaxis protein